MTVDYYSLMTKAVAGKDAAARDQIYKDAFGLITKSHLTREAASSHAAALEDAIRRIEDDIAAEEANSAAAINEVLSTEKELEAVRRRRLRARCRDRPVGLGLWLCRNQGPRHRRKRRRHGVIAKSAARARRRRHGGPEARRGRRLFGRRPAICAAAASGVLPHHRRSRLDRGRSGKPLSLSDRCQQFRAPLRHRDRAGVPEGRQLLSRHEQA